MAHVPYLLHAENLNAIDLAADSESHELIGTVSRAKHGSILFFVHKKLLPYQLFDYRHEIGGFKGLDHPAGGS